MPPLASIWVGRVIEPLWEKMGKRKTTTEAIFSYIISNRLPRYLILYAWSFGHDDDTVQKYSWVLTAFLRSKNLKVKIQRDLFQMPTHILQNNACRLSSCLVKFTPLQQRSANKTGVSYLSWTVLNIASLYSCSREEKTEMDKKVSRSFWTFLSPPIHKVNLI